MQCCRCARNEKVVGHPSYFKPLVGIILAEQNEIEEGCANSRCN